MRWSREQWAMGLARVTGTRSTCCRRRVGCILVNQRGHVLATGYNGVAAGLSHCNELLARADGEATYPHACEGAFAPSGTRLDTCQAIHAEQNALLQCRDVHEIHTCYVTASPCITCTKLLLNSSCERIVYAEAYPHPGARRLWERSGRSWEMFVDLPQNELVKIICN